MSTTRQALELAVRADVDPRTAKKALEQGVGAVRGRAGERVRDALAEMGIQPDPAAAKGEP